MWDLDYNESWAPKNWCFETVVLEKTLESLMDCKEIQPVHSEGNQSWVFIVRTDVEAETPILWPPNVKNWLIGKVLGASVRSPTQDKVMQRGLMGKASQALGVPPGISEHVPQKPESACLMVLCFSTLLTHSGKSQLRASVFCIWKECFSSNPLW